jgi:hypothetical protein
MPMGSSRQTSWRRRGKCSASEFRLPATRRPVGSPRRVEQRDDRERLARLTELEEPFELRADPLGEVRPSAVDQRLDTRLGGTAKLGL